MKIEDLDTQLRNKLQFVESDIHPDEMDGVMAGLGLPQKRKTKPYLWIVGAFLLFAGSSAILYWATDTFKQNQPVALDNKTIAKTAPQAAPTPLENIAPIHTKKETNSTLNSNNTTLSIEKNVAKGQHQIMNSSKVKTIEFAIKNPVNETNETKPNVETQKSSTPTSFSKSSLISLNTTQKGIADEMIPVCLCPLDQLKKLGQTFETEAPKIPEKTYFDLKRTLNPELSFWVSAQSTNEQKSLIFANEMRVHKNFLSNYNKGLRNNWTTNAGVNLRVNLLPFLKLGTGVGYINTGQAFNYDFKINNIPVEDSATGNILGYITKPDSSSAHIVEKGAHNATYFSLPLSLSFKLFGAPRFEIGIEANYTHQWLLSEKGNSLAHNTLRLNASKTFKSSIGNYQLALPISFNPAQRTSFTLSPYFGKALQNVETNTILNTQRKYAGIQFSVNYRLLNH